MVLEKRGLSVQPCNLDSPPASIGAIAYCPEQVLNSKMAARIAKHATKLASGGTPIVLFSKPPNTELEVRECEIASAYLRAHGAIVVDHLDAWIEVLVLVAHHGVPPGASYSLITDPNSWLSMMLPVGKSSSATDVVLVDVSYSGKAKKTRAMQLPIAARLELQKNPSNLTGSNAAIAAVLHGGALGRRLKSSEFGPADISHAELLSPDWPRLDNQLSKLGLRAGDHETKVLLASLGVQVIRQAVATTPSAAVRIAKKAGYPVQMKTWGPGVASEAKGCLVETELESAADVRRAFASLQRASGNDEFAAIVRETPPEGRRCSVELENHKDLGWIIVLTAGGDSHAEVAPLRQPDAMRLAARIESSRESDSSINTEALADLLVRISFVAPCRSEHFKKLCAHSVVIGSSGCIVVDASAELSAKI